MENTFTPRESSRSPQVRSSYSPKSMSGDTEEVLATVLITQGRNIQSPQALTQWQPPHHLALWIRRQSQAPDPTLVSLIVKSVLWLTRASGPYSWMSLDKPSAWSRDFLILSAIRRKGSFPARVTVVTFPLHLQSCPEGPQDLHQQLLWDQVPGQAQERETLTVADYLS